MKTRALRRRYGRSAQRVTSPGGRALGWIADRPDLEFAMLYAGEMSPRQRSRIVRLILSDSGRPEFGSDWRSYLNDVDVERSLVSGRIVKFPSGMPSGLVTFSPGR